MVEKKLTQVRYCVVPIQPLEAAWLTLRGRGNRRGMGDFFSYLVTLFSRMIEQF